MSSAHPADGRPRQYPSKAARLRARVREMLHTPPGPPPAAAVVNDVLLVVSELVSNAERHGGGLSAFDARLDGDTIVLTVADTSPDVPRTRPRAPDATPGGFGWPLINRVSSHVSVTPTPGGKTITVAVPTCHPRTGDP